MRPSVDHARPHFEWVWAAATASGRACVDLAVDGERGLVHRPVALDHRAVVVDADEVGHADQVEAETERVDPEQLGVLGVASGDVAGDALVEPEAAEEAERGRQALLAVEALVLDRVELGQLVRGGMGHGTVIDGLLGVGASRLSVGAASGRGAGAELRRRGHAVEAVPQQARRGRSVSAVAGHRPVADPPVAGVVDHADDAEGHGLGPAGVDARGPELIADGDRDLAADHVDEGADGLRPHRAATSGASGRCRARGRPRRRTGSRRSSAAAGPRGCRRRACCRSGRRGGRRTARRWRRRGRLGRRSGGRGSAW